MKNLTEKRKTGNLGEDLACRFLIKHGFNIVDRNYLKKCGEIDIIAENMDILHFIEVKSVSCSPEPAGETMPQTTNESLNSNAGVMNSSFRPEDNVHSWKLQRIAKTIQIYLTEKEVSGETPWQIDVITVHIDKKRLISKVSLLENIII